MIERQEKQAVIYRFGRFEMNVKEGILRSNGEIVPLTPKIFEMLLLLVRKNGQMVGKDEIMQNVWADSFVEETNLTSNISRLRKILHEGGEEFIETFPKRGYCFRAEVEEVGNEIEIVRTRRITAKVRQIVEEDDSTALSKSNKTKSLAVLPFLTLGLKADDEYLGLGLADALITQLSRTGKIIVRPTSAVRCYAETSRDSMSVGRDLGVDTVLEGSVQKTLEQLRLTVRMVDTETEMPLWAEKFDFKLTDIFDLQDEISSRIVGALPLQLSDNEQRKLTARWTESAEIYGLYLKARFFLPRIDPEGLRKAISYFRETIALAPEAAPAYAGLAEACIVGSYFFSPQEMLRQAQQAAAKAVELDSESFEAHVSLGVVKYLYNWDWQDAEREFKSAVRLNPNYASAYGWYGLFLMQMRRFEEAFAMFEQGLKLDPLSSSLNAYLGLACLYACEADRAVEQCRKTLELDSNFLPALGFLGMAYLEKGDFAASIATFEKQCEVQRAAFPLANLAHACAVAGRENEARKILAELNQMSQEQSVLPLYFALVFAGLGEKEKMYDCLEKALDERNVLLPSTLNTDLRFQGLRSEARFQDLLRRVGFAAR